MLKSLHMFLDNMSGNCLLYGLCPILKQIVFLKNYYFLILILGFVY